MEKSEKVAYYCSELANRNNEKGSQNNAQNEDQHQQSHSNINLKANPHNNNNINNNQFAPVSDDQHRTDQDLQLNAKYDAQSFSQNQVDYHQGNPEENLSIQPQAIQTSMHNQVLQRQQPLVNSSQSQFLVSNPSTNAHHIAVQKAMRQQPKISVQTFTPNAQNHPSYQINSNHQLYQAGVQQEQPQVRPIFHRKTPSMNEEHTNIQNSINPDTKQNFEHGSHHRQFPSNQSNPTDDRLRRKSEPLSITNEVGLENLNLDLEVMLMNGAQNINSNNANNMKHVIQVHPEDRARHDDVYFVDQQGTSGMSNKNDPSFKHPGTQSQASKEGPYIVYNKSDDNIYEEIDMMTMKGLRPDYQVETSSLHSGDWKKKNSKKFISASFTRWFSTRKKSSGNQNSDQEESNYIDSKFHIRPRLITLPEISNDHLTPEKLKRRLIVSSIVDSENSYTSSLYRLIFEYKKPLEEADPPILSQNKIGVIFYQLDQILQFHRIFGLSLGDQVQRWDQEEMLGTVFTSFFSRTYVFDIYSGFINNFTNAMETARRASKSKAFAQFLHDKSISSPDRLSFFGSMVKPVQRLPQFILLLSDLLKHTPVNHADRMPLQNALTELESLADRLNERKRDAERHFAVKQLLKDHLNESNTYSQRFLIRQDEVCLLAMDQSANTIAKSKTRKIYLLNDMLICVSLPSNRLKFAVPLCDISIIETNAPGVDSLMTHSNYKNVNEIPATSTSSQNYNIERMECDHQSLLHDLELMMRISALVASLRFQYNGFNPAAPEQICLGIREEIRKKEFQITMIDRSCLQLRLNSKNQKNTLVVQFANPDMKRTWLVDFRLTKLALDRANNPGWENVNENLPPSHHASLCIMGQRVPLFVKSLAIFKSEQSHLTCALHYYMRQTPFIGDNPSGVLWICNVNVNVSSLGALSTSGAEVNLIHSYELSESHVTCLESVGSTLWIGLRQGRIIVIDATSPQEWRQFASLDVQQEVKCLKHFGHFVYVGLINGVVAVFDAINYDKPFLIQLSQSPVTCLLPINEEVFACSYNKIWRIKDTAIVGSLTMQTNQAGLVPLEEEPNLLAHCGNGIWVSLIDSANVKLFHAETLEHLIDIDVGSKIRRVLNDVNEEIKIVVTSMMATRGLLWIGTNVGMIATLSLPRLKGAPLVSGGVNIALHRFLGPVNILINLTAGSECMPHSPFNTKQSTSSKQHAKNDEAEAIYGQYADLMNVGDYITTGKKNNNDKLSWEFSNMNISAMNNSDDSVSTASSGAIYQDGLPRGMKAVQNKAVITSSMMNNNVAYQESLQPDQMKHQQQSLPNKPQYSIEADATSTDYGSSSSKMMNKFYDEPLQLLQQKQQQIINQASAPMADGSAIGNMPVHVNQSKPYGTSGKGQRGQKTVLVLAGGNGYQRMALGDNKPFGEHAHCIIWEYKA